MVADEAEKRYGKEGIISVAQDPGKLKRQIYNTQSKLIMLFINKLLYPLKLGGYTEKYAGLSPEITEKQQGGLVIPSGRVQAQNPRNDIHEALEEGRVKEVWDWIEAQIKAHAWLMNTIFI
ncbi:hypothetical protein N7510_002319 [Penicillium lagena]|uniref:uncharacterized protein n=1 Tax=Penicillium lagena TaxID=94218 RepID=UPI00253FB12D|nr:uncharacterized protein N7510_002319 [Penicillium lagena]KAJ5626010.1 hypothetical protein N7510_002319 [Penicillium lagena]